MIEVHYIGDSLPVPPGGPRRRKLTELLGVVVHRFGGWVEGCFLYPTTAEGCRRLHIPWKPELAGRVYDDSPLGVARFFGEIFGWRHPYTLQEHRGQLFQTAPLDVVTPHAGAFNRTHVSIMIPGDHRKGPPRVDALEVAAAGVAGLCFAQRWHPLAWVTLEGHRRHRVLGHDELPAGATSTPGKQCPGDGLSMPAFRDSVAVHLQVLQDNRLDHSGLVLTS